MSHQIESRDAVMEWEIEVSGEDTEADAPQIRAMDKALRTWKDATDLDVVEFSTTAELVFTYEVKHKDGRVVVGVWDFTGDLHNPTVTIDAPDPWKTTELIRLDVENATIGAVGELGMSSMVVKFF